MKIRDLILVVPMMAIFNGCDSGSSDSSLQSAYDSLKSTYDTLASNYNSLKSTYDSQTSTLTSTESELADTKTDRDNKSDALTASNLALATANANLAAKDELAAKETELAVLKQKQEDADQSCSGIGSQTSNLVSTLLGSDLSTDQQNTVINAAINSAASNYPGCSRALVELTTQYKRTLNGRLAQADHNQYISNVVKALVEKNVVSKAKAVAADSNGQISATNIVRLMGMASSAAKSARSVFSNLNTESGKVLNSVVSSSADNGLKQLNRVPSSGSAVAEVTTSVVDTSPLEAKRAVTRTVRDRVPGKGDINLVY